jgi:alkylation response protein AidB-like acyl-CoA dehydrogenase
VTDTWAQSDGVEDLDAIVATADQFIRSQLPADWVDAVDRGDIDALFAARKGVEPADIWTRVAAGGYIVPTWAVEHGGLGLSSTAGAATMRVLSRYRLPSFQSTVGVDMVGPALLKWGTPEQQQRYLPPIAAYLKIWCQLFSETGAGSDLAGLALRATRDGDGWHLNGQKVWTSLGDIADLGLLLARTAPDLPKHRGITAFLLPMNVPGVVIRPIRQLTGEAEFSEVFVDDVVIDDSMRLGPENEGWRVAMSVLMNERRAVSASGASMPSTVTGRSVTALIARHAPLADWTLRQRLAQAFIEDKVVTMTNQRAAARRRAGQPAGPEGSIGKLLFSEHTQRLQNLAADLEGCAAQAWLEGDRWLMGTAWSLLRVRSKTIAGGTSEVQRNILGERILGLPKEAEVDRDIPWSQVLRS